LDPQNFWAGYATGNIDRTKEVQLNKLGEPCGKTYNDSVYSLFLWSSRIAQRTQKRGVIVQSCCHFISYSGIWTAPTWCGDRWQKWPLVGTKRGKILFEQRK